MPTLERRKQWYKEAKPSKYHSWQVSASERGPQLGSMPVKVADYSHTLAKVLLCSSNRCYGGPRSSKNETHSPNEVIPSPPMPSETVALTLPKARPSRQQPGALSCAFLNLS